MSSRRSERKLRKAGTVREAQDAEYLKQSVRDSRPWWLLFLPVGLILLTGVVIYLNLNSSDEETETSAPASAELQSEVQSDEDGTDGSTSGDDDAESVIAGANDDESDDGAEAAASDGSDDGAEAIKPSTIPEPPTDGPYVDATLTDNVFVLSGVVPDEETKVALETRAEISYTPFFSSELVVDESVESAEWLASAPEVVGLIPMITDGTIRIQDESVVLAGRSPNSDWSALFEQTVGGLTGLPVSSEGIEITGLQPPRFAAVVEDGQVSLDGVVPSEAIEQTFVQGAGAVYGPENVASTLVIDEGTYSSFWMYTMPGVFQLFQPFQAYDIQVENGITSGSMQGGVLFDLNSSEIGEDAAQVLGVGVAMLARDRSLNMQVVGHTDDQGPPEINEELSLERAVSVVEFFSGNGIDQGRLAAEGRGPDEPIASNETEEGRALNRRVEFVFGYQPLEG